MSIEIHPTAIVDPTSIIGEGTRIGPYCVVEPDVTIGAHCELQSHVVLRKYTTLGARVKLHAFSVIGGEPQHTGFKGEKTKVVIGDDTVLRESSTVHRGTSFGGGITTVGKECLIMAYAHIAHDCKVGDGVILANAVNVAGHCILEDRVNVGGVTGITQHVRIGRYAYIGGGSLLRKDLPPFLMGKGNDFHVQGINAIGLTRNGFSEKTVSRLRELYRVFYLRHLTVNRAIEQALVELGASEEIRLFLDFVRSSKAGVVR